MAAGRNLNYQQIIDLMRKNEIIIIDVRERQEVRMDGAIPGSVNIPQHQVKEALSQLSNAEFRKRYGFPMPSKETTLVFMCNSGGRSKRAMQVALSLGYVNSCNYMGGYEDWRRHNGKRHNTDTV